MSKEENISGYPRNFFAINEIIMIVSGVWYPDIKFPKCRKYLYFMYCSVFHLFGATFFVCEVLRLSETLQSPKKLVAHIGMLLTHCMGIFKAGILVLRRKQIEKVMKQLHDCQYYYGTFGKCNPGQIMLREKKISSMVAVGVSWYQTMYLNITIMVIYYYNCNNFAELALVCLCVIKTKTSVGILAI